MLQKISDACKEFSLVPVRIALGWIFIAHGAQKLFGLWGGSGLKTFAASLESMGMRPAMIWAILAACGEFFGGVMVLLGFYARFGALLISIVMVVAIATFHGANGFFLSNRGYEYNVALLGLSLCILFGGAGRFAWKRD